MGLFKKNDTSVFLPSEEEEIEQEDFNQVPQTPSPAFNLKINDGNQQNQEVVLDAEEPENNFDFSIYEQPEDPKLVEIAKLASTYKSTIKKDISSSIAIIDTNDNLDDNTKSIVINQIKTFVNQRQDLTQEQKDLLIPMFIDDFTAFGPLTPLMREDTINEIMVNGAGTDEEGNYLPHTVWIERKGKLHKLNNIFFDGEEHVRDIINKMASQVGRRCDESTPMLQARLLDGSRINCTIPPISIDGSSINIRKFDKNKVSIEKMIGYGSMTKNMASFLRCCVQARCNIIVSGGTGSGKTSMLNALSTFIQPDQRIVTIEDTAELLLQQPHVVRREARPANAEGSGEITIRDLVQNSLRERPDRIIVGEVRGKECLDMLQAMNTGHSGSSSTIHANSPSDVFERVETLCKYADPSMSTESATRQMASAFDIIVQVERYADGVRRVSSICTVNGVEGTKVLIDKLFEYYQDGKYSKFKASDSQPSGKVLEKIRSSNVFYDPSWFFNEE